MESLWSVSKLLSTESVGSRFELVANCVHTADADATVLSRRRCVLGLRYLHHIRQSDILVHLTVGVELSQL